MNKDAHPDSAHPSSSLSLAEATRELLTAIFSDPAYLKLSWQFESSDIPMMRELADGYFASSVATVSNMMPLHILVHDLDDYRMVNAKTRSSLADCCEYFLGKRLNKAQQISDWLARPLSSHQLQYAALDAYSTVMILAALVKKHSSSDPSSSVSSAATTASISMASNPKSKIYRYLELIANNPHLVETLLKTLSN
jgi:hypothetical protein